MIFHRRLSSKAEIWPKKTIIWQSIANILRDSDPQPNPQSNFQGPPSPSVNHFGTYLRAYMHSYVQSPFREISLTKSYETKYVRNFTCQCSNFSLFCQNPMYDRKNDFLDLKSKLIHPKAHALYTKIYWIRMTQNYLNQCYIFSI